MEKINFSFSLNEEQKKIKENICEKLCIHPRVQAFMKEYNVDKRYIYDHSGKISDWIEVQEKCDRCKGLDFCAMSIKGHYLDLSMEDGFLQNEMKKCRYQKKYDVEVMHSKKYTMNDMKENYLRINLSDVDLSKESLEYKGAVAKAVKFIKNPEKGLYVYGQPGVGKTYLMAGITNELAKKNKRIAFVNVPKYISELKMMFRDADAFDRKVRMLKQIDYLVLDDIGGESVTAWSRDEILLPLLDERMEKGKVTLFTSNYSMKELLERLTITNNALKEPMAAKRLLDRIKALSDEVFIKGSSRRK